MMSLKKSWWLFLLCLISASNFAVDPRRAKYEQTKDMELKQKVFAILQNNCNRCHKIRNPRRVFTIENMENNAKKIKEQVFELKRMPKGKKNKLSSDDFETLAQWIDKLEG